MPVLFREVTLDAPLGLHRQFVTDVGNYDVKKVGANWRLTDMTTELYRDFRTIADVRKRVRELVEGNRRAAMRLAAARAAADDLRVKPRQSITSLYSDPEPGADHFVVHRRRRVEGPAPFGMEGKAERDRKEAGRAYVAAVTSAYHDTDGHACGYSCANRGNVPRPGSRSVGPIQ